MQKNTDIKSLAKKITEYDLLLLFISTISISIMFLMTLEIFSSLRVLILGLFLFSVLIYSYRSILSKLSFNLKKIDFWLLTIILIALFLRSNISTNYMGGQDQGLYVSFSGVLNNFGSPFFIDKFRSTLPASLQIFYDSAVMSSVVPMGDGLRYEISFYPLHPGWMAVFETMLGRDRHGVSVLFFSLLSISGAYLLTRELVGNGSQNEARLAALFMAVNPVLCFLAKFPLSETQSMALMLNAAYLLVKGLKSQGLIQILLFGTSLLLIFCYMFTRLSFPILIVPWIALYFLSYSRWVTSLSGVNLRVYLWLCVVAAVGATIIYRIMLPFLYSDILEVYETIIVAHKVLSFTLLNVMILILVLLRIEKIRLRLQILIDQGIIFGINLSIWLPLAVLMISIPSILNLSNADTIFNGIKVIPEFENFRYHLVYRFFLVMTPPLWLMFIGLPILISSKPAISIPIFFVCGVWTLALLFSPTLPYLYYHSRYIASEILPFSLVIMSITLVSMWGAGGWRHLFSTAITFSALIVMIVFSLIQIQGTEGEDPNFFHELNLAVSNNDILVVNESEMDNRITVPIRYYFNKQIFVIPRNISSSETRNIFKELKNKSGEQYGRILHLTTLRPTSDLIKRSLLGSFVFKESVFTNTEHGRFDGYQNKDWGQMLLPYKLKTLNRTTFLYSIDFVLNTPYLFGNLIDFSSIGNSSIYTNYGWSVQEPEGRWTVGHTASLEIPFEPSSIAATTENIVLCINAISFSSTGSPQRVMVEINGKPLTTLSIESKSARNYEISFNKSYLSGDGPVILKLYLIDAHSPYSKRVSQDTRELGLFVRNIIFQNTPSR